jgi:ABC-type uncharacterized transport system substrate-binding protein
MKRREFITLLGGAATAWPLAARAQQRAMPVVGLLSNASPGPYSDIVAAFRQGLSEAGKVQGRDVTIEYRWAEGQNDRLPGLVADLVRRQVAIIVTTGIPETLAAKAATRTIPIVFQVGVDPADIGIVPSLNRPGGNLTGVTNFNAEVGPKRLELLRELLPTAPVMALLVNPTNPTAAEILWRDVQAAAHLLGLQLHRLQASNDREIDDAFASLLRLRASALVIAPDVFFNTRSEQLAALTLRPRDARDLPVSLFCRCRRLDELRGQSYGVVPSGRPLHWPHSQGRESGGPASPPGHESRAVHQPQDRQGARYHRAAGAARAGRRGHRVMRRRDFITLLGGAAVTWPLAARAQQPAMPVIGFLSALSEKEV